MATTVKEGTSERSAIVPERNAIVPERSAIGGRYVGFNPSNRGSDRNLECKFLSKNEHRTVLLYTLYWLLGRLG